MNSFAEVMRQKYPEVLATVQITQDDLIVRMTIETDDGHREIVEQMLKEYGLVVSGNLPPSALLPNSMDVLRLENQLAIVNTQLDNARRILQVTQANYEARIESLEMGHLSFRTTHRF